MSEPLALLDREPVSGHTPFLCRLGGGYRYACLEEQRAALLAALEEGGEGDGITRVVGCASRAVAPTQSSDAQDVADLPRVQTLLVPEGY